MFSQRPLSFLWSLLLILISTLACARISGTPTSTPVVTSSDPHVELSADATTLAIGDLVTVTGQAVDIGLPYFQILLKDAGAAEFAPLAQVTYENKIQSSADVSQVLELVSAEGNYTQVVITLRARAAGSTEIAISATGEVHSSQGYMWSGGGSESLMIIVTSP